MLVVRKQFIALLGMLALLLAAHDTQAASSGYTPCIVQPVLIRPNISQPVITQAELVRPTFIVTGRDRWTVDLADIDQPAYIQAVFAPTLYDGCADLNSARSAVMARFALTPFATTAPRPGNGSVASRIFTDASLCCGAGGK